MILNTNYLEKDTEHNLFKRFKAENDQKAYYVIVNSNLQNIKKIAYDFHSKNKTIPITELISIGNEVLLKAIATYNYVLGHRFYTYLKRSVVNSYVKSVNTYRLVRLPDKKYERFGKFSQGKIELTDSQVTNYERYSNLSFESISKQSSDGEYVMQLPSEDYDTTAIQDDLSEMKYCLDKLDFDERYIIDKFFGLTDERLTIEEIAEELECSTYRVITVKSAALQKLRKSYAKVGSFSLDRIFA